MAYFLQGVFFAGFAATATPRSGVPSFLLMRMAGGVIIPLHISLLQRTVPRQLQGRVFSLHSSTYGGVMQVSLLLTGILLANFGPHTTGLALGLAASTGGVAWLAAWRAGKFPTSETR